MLNRQKKSIERYTFQLANAFFQPLKFIVLINKIMLWWYIIIFYIFFKTMDPDPENPRIRIQNTDTR